MVYLGLDLFIPEVKKKQWEHKVKKYDKWFIKDIYIPLRSLGLIDKPFSEILKLFLHIFSIGPIFNLLTANDRYKKIPEDFFSFFPRSTRWGFRTDFVNKIEYFFQPHNRF